MSAVNHINGIFNEIVGEVTDTMTFDEIFGQNGTMVFYNKLMEKINDYRKKEQYFVKDHDGLEPIDDRLSLVKFDAIDKKTGFGIKIILNPIMPADADLAKSLSKKKTSELNMEAEKFEGNKRLELVKNLSNNLKNEDYFMAMTPAQRESHISKILNLDDQYNNTERKILDFGLNSEETKELILEGLKAIFSKK
jgi:hypothetical protein